MNYLSGKIVDFERVIAGDDAAAMLALARELLLGAEWTSGSSLHICASKARMLIELSAEKGHAPALLFMSECYMTGRLGFVRDMRKAELLLLDSCRLGSLDATVRLGEMYVFDVRFESRVNEGLMLLERAAQIGSAIASLLLAEFQISKGLPGALECVERCIRLANDRCPEREGILMRAGRALLRLTYLCEAHIGLPPMNARVSNVIGSSDVQQNSLICRALEVFEMVAKSEREFMEPIHSLWYKNQRWESASGAIARIRLFSIGRTKDVMAGADWLEVAASLGDGWARYFKAFINFADCRQGLAYELGKCLGLTNSKREAANLLHELAVDDYWEIDPYRISANTQYAMFSMNGVGIKQDLNESRFYLERAALAGDCLAQVEVASLYYSGRGCSKDCAVALKFYSMAAALGSRRGLVQMRKISTQISPDEVAKVQSEARMFFDEVAVQDEWFDINYSLARIRNIYPFNGLASRSG